METKRTRKDYVIVKFSGDSGDGMQLIGNIFAEANAQLGKNISTFPDYPAEIRPPQGTVRGVSGFQVNLGGLQVKTPGDKCDVLFALNPAVIKANKDKISRSGVIIIDQDSITDSDLKKAGYLTDNIFEEDGLADYRIVPIQVSTMVKTALEGSGLDNKAINMSRNMFILGLACWMFDIPLEIIAEKINKKFAKKPEIAKANLTVIQAGITYGNNIHLTTPSFIVSTAELPKGRYHNINGNVAIAWGFIAAADIAKLDLFLGSYPITPATEILVELQNRRSLGVKAFQAEDEIAGICSSIGAAFAGNLAVTTTSGPGMALKSEAIGLATIAELPLVIVNVQRGGPSTGLPTKTEQSDLYQALYGRNGETSVVVLAPTSPADCFTMAYQACKIALENMVPVILLSDTYMANGSEAWRIPADGELPEIKVPFAFEKNSEKEFLPFKRQEGSFVRTWAIPGTPECQHRIGGLEKNEDGSVSTAPLVHEKNSYIRQQKVDTIRVPDLVVEGDTEGDLLIVGWGSTYGHLSTAFDNVSAATDKKIGHAHFNYINPLPANTREVFSKYKHICVCELNMGQFVNFLRMKFPEFQYSQYNKMYGQPFSVKEIEEQIVKILGK